MRRHLAVYVIGLACAITAEAFDVTIESQPAGYIRRIAPVPELPSCDDGVRLQSWLGGEDAIARVVVDPPFANQDQLVLTPEMVRKRFAESKCANSRRNLRHIAPFTNGVIYLKSGKKIPFGMLLNEITIGPNVFTL